MTKHYIRLDGEFITKGFTDAFEQPKEGDICINENGQRHFELFEKTNPSIMDSDGFSLYKYVNDKIIPATQEEQPQYIEIIQQKNDQKRVSNIAVEIAKAYSITDEIGIIRDALATLLPDDTTVQDWNMVVENAKIIYPK